MKRLIPVILAVLAGCATAPVSFCESAFPTKERFSLNLAGEMNLNLSDMGSDQMNNETYPPSFGMNLFMLSASVSPIPIMTITPMFYGPESAGWLVRAKATMFSNENAAAALIFGGGTNNGTLSELDLWDSGYVGKYSATTLQAGGIYSIGQRDRGKGGYSFNMGPKVVYTNLDYTDYHWEEERNFRGELWDFGGFLGMTALKRLGPVGLRLWFEFSALAVDVPIPRSRELALYFGSGFGVGF